MCENPTYLWGFGKRKLYNILKLLGEGNVESIIPDTLR